MRPAVIRGVGPLPPPLNPKEAKAGKNRAGTWFVICLLFGITKLSCPDQSTQHRNVLDPLTRPPPSTPSTVVRIRSREDEGSAEWARNHAPIGQSSQRDRLTQTHPSGPATCGSLLHQSIDLNRRDASGLRSRRPLSESGAPRIRRTQGQLGVESEARGGPGHTAPVALPPFAL